MARISLDFGTCFSSCAFMHGDKVMPLSISKGSRVSRLPSVFYHDENRTLFGEKAEKAGERRPDCVVRYLKKKLDEPFFLLADRKYTSQEILQELMTHVLQGADEMLCRDFHNEDEKLEVILTVPVTKFGEREKKILQDSVAKVHLESGRKVEVLEVLTEPVAAALEYFAEKNKTEGGILVFDLGGGTFDVAVLQATGEEKEPYRVLGQDGCGIGGSDWDERLLGLVEEKLRAIVPKEQGEQLEGVLKRERYKLLLEARNSKEELSHLDEAIFEFPFLGDILSVCVSREEFKEASKELQRRIFRIADHLLKETQKFCPVQEVILVGGSSYMPQIREEAERLFSDCKVYITNPDYAVSYGAARYERRLGVEQKKKAEQKKKEVVRIGIDFGNTFSFAAFVHGNKTMSLLSNREKGGIPSVFYYDGEREWVGTAAERLAKIHPENAVHSVKRKLDQSFELSGRVFSAEEIVIKILSYVLNCVEESLEKKYFVQYDVLEAVISVPVEFTPPRVLFIRQAAEKVKLKSGRQLRVIGMIPEPCAAAIAYLGMTQKDNSNVLVYDLGGGTFDAALVRADQAAETFYEVLAMKGAAVGGDDWDKRLELWMLERCRKKGLTGKKIEEEIRQKSRSYKEELTEEEEVLFSISARGDEYEEKITRQEFEEITKDLLEVTFEKLRLLLRERRESIDHVILTGGSSYMPQIKEDLMSQGFFANGTKPRLYEPEYAIANGAAMYADTLREKRKRQGKPPKKLISLIAPHSYGIVYFVREFGKPMVKILIREGTKLPVTVRNESMVKEEGENRSNYVVYELMDGATEQKGYAERSQGREIMEVFLERETKLPKGSRATQILTLEEDGVLHIQAEDKIASVKVEAKLKIRQNLS